MAVDHCFSIKGQGTVMTGTVLSGSVSIGDNVEIPALKVNLISSSKIELKSEFVFPPSLGVSICFLTFHTNLSCLPVGIPLENTVQYCVALNVVLLNGFMKNVICKGNGSLRPQKQKHEGISNG